MRDSIRFAGQLSELIGRGWGKVGKELLTSSGSTAILCFSHATFTSHSLHFYPFHSLYFYPFHILYLFTLYIYEYIKLQSASIFFFSFQRMSYSVSFIKQQN